MTRVETPRTPAAHSWQPLLELWAAALSPEPDELQQALTELLELLSLGCPRARPLAPLLSAISSEGSLPLPPFHPREFQLEPLPRSELMLVGVEGDQVRLRLRFPLIPRAPLRTRVFSRLLPPQLMSPLVFWDVLPSPPRVRESAELFATLSLAELLGDEPISIELYHSSYDTSFDDFASRADRLWWASHARGRDFLREHLFELASAPRRLRPVVLDALVGSLVRVLGAPVRAPELTRAILATRLRLALGSYASFPGGPELDVRWVGELFAAAFLLGVSNPQERALAAQLAGSLGASPVAFAAAIAASLAPPRSTGAS